MAREIDLEQWRTELVDALHWGEQERARTLVATLREAQPRRAWSVLERMLQSLDGKVRQAAAFGLGELGGPTSARLLEQQLLVEESRGDSDASSVVQVITQALSQLKSASSRATLVRRLNRLAAGAPEGSDVDDLTYALWRKRHPALLSAVRGALERIAPPASEGLRALLRLLESSPEELRVWMENESVPVEQKTKVLTILDEEVPEELVPLLPSVIFLARSIIEVASTRKGQERRFCDRLFTLLLFHRERLLPTLPPEARAALREVARRMVAAPETVRIIKAATLLEYVGYREDADLLAEHKPQDEVLGRVYEEAVEALRKRPRELGALGSLRRGLQGKADSWLVIIGCVALLASRAQATSPTPDEFSSGITSTDQYFLEYWNPYRTRPTVLAYPKGQGTGPRTAVSQHPLHDATKEQLRSILGLHVDDPMTGWHPVRTEAQAAALSRFLDTPLDLAAHDHAVDYYQPLHEPRAPSEKK